jgi:hypothetical protein
MDNPTLWANLTTNINLQISMSDSKLGCILDSVEDHSVAIAPLDNADASPFVG